jgi:AraC family transcriptional regulator, transcriptional activator of pobA
MNPVAATPVTFSHRKYGQPLAVDASSFPHWTGIVPDGEPHVLDFHEFLVVAAGAADISMGERSIRVAGPTVVFTPPSVVRRVEIIDPLRLQLVVFSDRALRRAPWASALIGLSAGSLPVPEPALLEPLNGLVQQMTDELSSPRNDSALMLDALLAQFVITLSRRNGTRAAEAPVLAARFERLLDTGYRHTHAVSSYAVRLGVTPDHLSSVVRSHYGFGAKTMIERRLLAEAVRLLTTTRLSIADVAACLGFDEPSHFTRFFSRASGQAPRRFRAH